MSQKFPIKRKESVNISKLYNHRTCLIMKRTKDLRYAVEAIEEDVCERRYLEQKIKKMEEMKDLREQEKIVDRKAHEQEMMMRKELEIRKRKISEIDEIEKEEADLEDKIKRLKQSSNEKKIQE